MYPATQIVHLGRNSARYEGMVNPPVYRASTVLFPDLQAYHARTERRYENQTVYGTCGTPTTFELAETIARLEEAHDAVITSSGLSAICLALLSVLRAGDDVLVSDGVYAPTRQFCDSMLQRFGVRVRYYPPRCGGAIAQWFQANTRAVFAESPSSLSFEVQDLPALAQAAHAHNALLIVDNTWASSLFCHPLQHGADLSLQAITKYAAGHSDLVLGSIAVANASLARQIKDCIFTMGDAAAPDVCYLALRGLRTMAVRMRHQAVSGIRIARWLQTQAQVKYVLHPALSDHPDHALWRRDFSGTASLFGVLLHTTDANAVDRLLRSLRFFGLGASWGGYESLILPASPTRTAVPWAEPGTLLRLHIGLEDIRDLCADLSAALPHLDG